MKNNSSETGTSVIRESLSATNKYLQSKINSDVGGLSWRRSGPLALNCDDHDARVVVVRLVEGRVHDARVSEREDVRPRRLLDADWLLRVVGEDGFLPRDGGVGAEVGRRRDTPVDGRWLRVWKSAHSNVHQCYSREKTRDFSLIKNSPHFAPAATLDWTRSTCNAISANASTRSVDIRAKSLNYLRHLPFTVMVKEHFALFLLMSSAM